MKQKKLIILDGPDRVGKSTLCNQIAEILDLDVYHFGVPKNPDHFYDFLKVDFSKSMLFDRSWLSRIYYTVYRQNHYPINSLYQIREIEKIFKLNGFDIYYFMIYNRWKIVINRHISEIQNGGNLSLFSRLKEHKGWIPFLMKISPYLLNGVNYAGNYADITESISTGPRDIGIDQRIRNEFEYQRTNNPTEIFRLDGYWSSKFERD